MSENNCKKCENYANLFKALSNPIRVRIVFGLMKKDECNVSNMVKNLNIPQPTVSQHLNILKNSGIIEGFRRGNQICYKVVNEEVTKMLENLK